MDKPQKNTDLNRLKFRTDILLFLGIVAASLSHITGITAHEWISLCLFLLVLWHMGVNWNGIAGGIKNFTRISWTFRLALAWDILLYWVIVLVMVSGLLTSRAVLPTLGYYIENDAFLSWLHKQLPPILSIMMGIHLGAHIAWVAARFRRKNAGLKPDNNQSTNNSAPFAAESEAQS